MFMIGSHLEACMMAIKRIGQFIEFLGDEGVRNIVRVNAIQWMCDTDETAEETYLTVASRALLGRALLDELREALMVEGRLLASPVVTGLGSLGMAIIASSVRAIVAWVTAPRTPSIEIDLLVRLQT